MERQGEGGIGGKVRRMKKCWEERPKEEMKRQGEEVIRR